MLCSKAEGAEGGVFPGLELCGNSGVSDCDGINSGTSGTTFCGIGGTADELTETCGGVCSLRMSSSVTSNENE
ncbi:hypothetical protein [Prevotella koreensis]